MEGSIEFDLGHGRACDYGSELELDLLDEDYENAGSEPWKELAEAQEATISRKRSMEPRGKDCTITKNRG